MLVRNEYEQFIQDDQDIMNDEDYIQIQQAMEGKLPLQLSAVKEEERDSKFTVSNA